MGGGGGGSVSIRGMGTDSRESQSSTGIYIDEVYYPSTYGNVLGLLDVESVEILRGPQGTLFGRNTIAGAIQYRSAAPEEELSGYLSGVVGNYDRTNIDGAISIPVSESFRLRLAGLYNEIEGYVDNITDGDTEGDSETSAFRIRADWDVTDRLAIKLKAETISNKLEGRNNIVGAINPNAQFPFLASIGLGIPGVPGVDLTGYDASLVLPYDDPDDFAIVGLNAPDELDFDFSVFQATVEYELTDKLTLKSISAFFDSETEFKQDFDQTPFPILATEVRSELDGFSQELQFSGTAADDRLGFVAGIFYFESDDLGSAATLNDIGLVLTPRSTPLPGIETASFALFGQGTYDLTDSLSLSFGVRYTEEEVTSYFENTPGSELKFDFDDVSPHIGINFEASDNTFYYAKASKGFRAGGNTPSLALPGNGLSYDPEEAWSYELGARLTISDTFRINPTVFWTDWEDVQSLVVIFTPAPVATTQNIGEADIYGLEVEGEWLISQAFTLNFSGAYMESEWKSFEPILTSNGGISEDAPLPGLPELKLTVGGNYQRELSNGMIFDLSADYTYTDEMRSVLQDSGAITLDSYGLLGARATLQVSEDLSITLFGSNLTDEVYFIGGVDYANGATAGNQELNVGRGRAYGLEGKLSF